MQPPIPQTYSLLIIAGLLVSSLYLVAGDEQAGAPDELVAADESQLVASSATSHLVLVSGWPKTSAMWPSLEVADNQPPPAPAASLSAPAEPFIYADKPRTTDYSLLLALNASILDNLRARPKPMTLALSFEFYFDHDPKVTALPGIKIELDRKQLNYLEPESGATSSPTSQVKRRLWNKFNQLIVIADSAQFEKFDWLKFSLINRQSPSLVAIRRLRAEFKTMNPADANQQPMADQPATPAPQGAVPSPAVQQVAPAGEPAPNVRYQTPTDQTANPTAVQQPPALPVQPLAPNPNPQQQPPLVADPATVPAVPPVPAPLPVQQPARGGAQPVEYTQAGSNALETRIAPVSPKKKGLSQLFGRRKKRQVTPSEQGQTAVNQNADSITLICYTSDACDWRWDSKEEDILWSLARMPPSTETVKSGYYYVSNRNNYGDLSKMLILTLNQTESATIADQNSDHCLTIALYVTEGSFLNLYKLTPTIEGQRATGQQLQVESSWIKSPIVMTWAPTLVGSIGGKGRSALLGSRLPAMEANRSGWTPETLCFGDFFTQPKECGSGRCALAFEMRDLIRQSHLDNATHTNPDHLAEGTAQKNSQEDLLALATSDPDEQVAGVALLSEYTLNVPTKSQRQRWLDTWLREEVEPEDSWKFYPKLDFALGRANGSLLNMLDYAHYSVHSDWIQADENLSLDAILSIQVGWPNGTSGDNQTEPDFALAEQPVFGFKLNTKIVDSHFELVHNANLTVEFLVKDNSSVAFNLSMPISEHLKRAEQFHQFASESQKPLFKVIFELVIDCHWLQGHLGSQISNFLSSRQIGYNLALANVSISDRCYPNPCEFGSCQQNGTGFEDWNCSCDEQHRGRRCQFGRWCSIAHVTPWVPPPAATALTSARQATVPVANRQLNGHSINRQPRLEAVAKVTGREYCQRKLGQGSKCTEIDLPLNDNLYNQDELTFSCNCLDDFYLGDEQKCRQAHLCNSIVCPSIGMVCDETRPFNRSQPCSCDERQDWYPSTSDPLKCIRRQCHDKQRDCGFDAHICLPTLPGERPICKCGPKFVLRVDSRGQKYCQSSACVLPTLNDCEHLCQPDNSNLERPYTCACHPGFQLDMSDKRSCKPQRTDQTPHCKPACEPRTQICTDVGCKCRQGYIGEAQVIAPLVPRRTNSEVRQLPPLSAATTANNQTGSSWSTASGYIQSVRCLNVCSLSYAENKEQFERIESVCPLGLCEPDTFFCRCADPQSSALINTKYEPVRTFINGTNELEPRNSPLCRLKRVCEPNSSGYKICRSQGAICVPDYTKPSMFDCLCPPSTEKRFFGQATAGEFSCEPKCGSKRYDCLRRQATCKLVARNEVRCECLPGFILDQADNKCYLAKYTYAFNLNIVNKYYETESRLIHRTNSNSNNSNNTRLTETINAELASVEHNQCNVTQALPKEVIEDPYEHDLESFLGYIDQCNERVLQTAKTYHLNSRLGDDIRQALRQHLRAFTVTTNNSSCIETDPMGLYLNCTIYLQSNEPIMSPLVERVFSECDKHGQDERFCWIKPRLLLKREQHSTTSPSSMLIANPLQNQAPPVLHQVYACEIDDFCGPDANARRLDDRSSLCSCKCPSDLEVIDLKDLEPRRNLLTEEASASIESSSGVTLSVKEVCAARNQCGVNSTFCLAKTGSSCHYDIRLGSRCLCSYPSYEDATGQCVEVAFSKLNDTLIVIIIMLGTALIVSVAINLAAMVKSRGVFGRSKEYPLHELNAEAMPARGRSTGVPNPVFTND